MLADVEGISDLESTASHTAQTVSLETFGKVVSWFAPFIDHNGDADTFVSRIRRVVCEPWFHGNLSTPMAEKLLAKHVHGSFLVRFSSTAPGTFTITVNHDGEVVHRSDSERSAKREHRKHRAHSGH